MMTTSILLLTALLAPVSQDAPAGSGGDQSTTSRAEFQELALSWMRAYNSNDSSALAGMYEEHAQYISGHVRGLVADGRDRVIANFRNGVLMGGHIDSVTVLAVEISCDLATLSCAFEATNGGQKASGRNLLVVKRSGHRWLIALHMTVV